MSPRVAPVRSLSATFALTWLLACSPDAAPVVLGPVDGRDLAPADTGRVQPGDAAPDFSLASYADGVITLSEYRGQKDIILVFYRGWW